MKVRSFLEDVGGASRVTKLRREKIQAASSVPDPKDPIRALADALHPGKQQFRVAGVRESSPTSKTWRFSPVNGHIAPFRAGQYAVFYLTIGSSVLTRPYTISSAPFEARGANPFFEVTIRRNVPYLVPDYFFEHIGEGDVVEAALPFGSFYYEPLRDAKNVVALAGGSGITPFVSMAKEIAAAVQGAPSDGLPARLTILYGSVKSDDIVCFEELAAAEAASGGRVRVVHVMSGDPDWTGEKGFISRALIEKYSEGDTTCLFCGPPAMYRAVSGIMQEMGVTPRRFRHDVMAQPSDVRQIPGFPAEAAGKEFRITVMRGIQKDEIPARADEPVAVALERAGIPVDAHCRGGECGYCRSRLLAGEIFVSPTGDGRRREDREMGWFHACSAYPMSDLTVKINII